MNSRDKDMDFLKIDLVYTWVDGNDPAWQARYRHTAGIDESAADSSCKGRYADNEELRYSLRSIARHAPWINHIYIVTDDQVPKWLNTDNPKISVVDHKDIIPTRYLPCFNSQIIEHFIHRVPGLSEHFLYANDDMFINRDVKPSDFFKADGYPVIRMNMRPFRRFTLYLRRKLLGKELNMYNRAILNAADLVSKRYGVFFGCKTHHNIDAYRKSDYEHTREIFKNEIEPTLINHFRARNDIQRNIYSYVPLAERKGHLKITSHRSSYRLHIDKNKYDKMIRCKPTFFCLNDSEFANDEDRRRAGEFLRSYFPDKSEYEL